MILMLKFGCLIEIVSDLPEVFPSRFSCLLFGTTLQARDHVGLLRGSLAQTCDTIGQNQATSCDFQQ